MNLSKNTKTWILLGVMIVVAIWHFSWPENRANTDVETQISAATSPQAPPTPNTPAADTQAAAKPAAAQPGADGASLPEPSAQEKASDVNTLPDEPVYIGHTDRVALQPGMIRALRQLIDTSHDGLQVQTHPDGTQIVDITDKFRHVAVAVRTPDGKIVWT